MDGSKILCLLGTVAASLLASCDSWPDSWDFYYPLKKMASDDGGSAQDMGADGSECTAPTLWPQTRLATGAQWIDLLTGGSPLADTSSATLKIEDGTAVITPSAPVALGPGAAGVRFSLKSAPFIPPNAYTVTGSNGKSVLGTGPLAVSKLLFSRKDSKTIAAAQPLWAQAVTDGDNNGATKKTVFVHDANGILYGVDRNPGDPLFSANAVSGNGNVRPSLLSVAAASSTPTSRFLGAHGSGPNKLDVCVRGLNFLNQQLDSCTQITQSNGTAAFPGNTITQVAMQKGSNLQSLRLAVIGKAKAGDSFDSVFDCKVNLAASKTTGICAVTYSGSSAQTAPSSVVAIGDLDGRDDQDTVFQSSDNSLTVVQTNTGDSTVCPDCIGTAAKITEPLISLQVLDVDGDSLQDIVGISSKNIHVWLQDSAKPGSFPSVRTSELALPAALQVKSAAQIIVGDITGDPARVKFPDVLLVASDGSFWTALNQTPALPDVRCSVENPWRGRFSTAAPVYTNLTGTDEQIKDTTPSISVSLDVERNPTDKRLGFLLAKPAALQLWQNNSVQ